jgi:nucleotide-binding universal stress UspA family protein
MLKHVLIPLDGSKLAEEALEYAKKILAPEGTLTLVSAVELPEILPSGIYPMVDPALVGVNYKDNKDTLYSPEQVISQAREYLEHIGSLFPSSTVVNVRVEVSEPAAFILKVADELKVDAIIISTHGRSGISRWLFGSVTQRILNHACRPVFVIPSRERMERTAKSESVANEQHV